MLNGPANAQVLSGWWNENFDGMPVNSLPGNDWMSTSNGVILSNFHQDDAAFSSNGNALSCNLTSLVNVDSILTPKITMHDDNNALSVCNLKYRISDWNNNAFVSQHNLVAGDTAYVIIYKYSGSQVVSQAISSKIHSGNQYNNGGGGINFANRYFFLPTIYYTDTFRVGVKMINHSLSDYWYDFDNFGMTYMSGLKKDIDNGSSVSLFPNPAKDEINIVLDSHVRSIKVIDMYGKSIDFKIETDQSPYRLQFDPSIPCGMYFISIKTDKAIINSKFLKE